MEENSYIPEQSEHEQPVQNVRNDWKAMVGRVSYRGIVYNIPFLAFLVFLCVIYITNNQKTIEVQRVVNAKNAELKELRWKYMDIKSKLMTVGMETEVIKNASVLGLKPMMMPAYRLELDSNKTHNN